MELHLQRHDDNGDATKGTLSVDDCLVCYTLEDEYRDVKVPGETRIPAGRYRIRKREYGRFYRAYNDRWGYPFVPVLEGVENFTDVLIHTGNTDEHTAGCILVGMGHRGYTLLDSRAAYVKLFDMIRDAIEADDCWITIEDELI